MSEHVRSVTITAEIDTTKATHAETFTDPADFAAWWNEQADDLSLPPMPASEAEYVRISNLTRARFALTILREMAPMEGEDARQLMVAIECVALLGSRLYRDD